MNTEPPQFPLGPFTLKNFDQVFWDKISEKLMLLENFSKQTILPEYQYFLQLLRQVNSSTGYDEYFGNTSVKEFFLGSFLPAAAVSLVDCRSSIDNDLRELINECLHQLVFLSLKSLKEDFRSPSRMLYLILDPVRPYYHPHKGIVPSKRDMIVDDQNDPEQKSLFAVARAYPYSSTQIVELINSFGEKGGFSSLLERISDTKNMLSASRMNVLCNMIANICPLLHRDFVRAYLPKLEEAVCLNLMSNAESDIDDSVQDSLMESFQVMFGRVYPNEKEKMLNHLKIKINQKGMNVSSPFKDKPQQTKPPIESSQDDGQLLLNWECSKSLSKNNIFDQIFESDTYSSLIKKQTSANYLQQLLNKNSLTSEELELLWKKIADGDEQVKSSIYDSLSKRSSPLPSPHVKYILSKLNETPLEEITNQDISLVKALLKQPQNCDFSSKEYWEFYWRMAHTNKNVDNSKDASMNIAFSELSIQITRRAHDFRKEIFNIMDQSLENIKNKVSVESSYEQIKSLIHHFRDHSQHPDKLTKSKCISYLCKERLLLHQILDDIKDEKERLSKSTILQQMETYLSNIKHRLDFVTDVLYCVKTQINIFTSDLLGNFLDLTVNKVSVPEERQLGVDFFKQIDIFNSELFISTEDLIKFYREKVNYQEFLCYKELDHNIFLCFRILLIMVNKRLANLIQLAPLVEDSSLWRYPKLENKKKSETDYSLKVPADQLEGIKDLWELSLDDKGYSVLSSLLVKIYMHPNVLSNRQSFLNICYKIIKEALENIENEKSKRRVLKCLSLISDAVKESEIEGFTNLKSHLGLTEGETLALQIRYHIHYFKRDEELYLDSNRSVFDLRLLIAKHFRTKWNSFSILKQKETSSEVHHKGKAKTLQEIGVLARQTLTVQETAAPVYYEENLLGKDGTTLNPKAKKIFMEWFEEFTDNNKMSPEQYCRFLNEFNCLYGDSRPHNSRVVRTFSDYDEDRDSYLNPEEFIKSQQFDYNIWSKLGKCHYRKDFKKVNSLGQIEINVKSLPRYLLSTNTEHFQLLYSLLDLGDEEIAAQAWDLVNILPTNIPIFEDIVMLKGVRNTPTSQARQNMGTLFNPKSPYKLLYALYAVLILIQNTFKDAKNNDKEEFIKEFLWPQNHKLQEYWQSWHTDFFNHDGLTHLIKLLKALSINNIKFQTTIKCLILKIIASYLPVKPISNANDISRIPCLKRLLKLLLDFGRDFMKGSQCQYLIALQTEVHNLNLPIDKEQEVQALHIISRINFRDLVEETINLCSPALTKDETNIDALDLAIFSSSLSILRSAVLYSENEK